MATIAMVSEGAQAQDYEPEALEADVADDRGCWVPSPEEIAEAAEAIRAKWDLVEHFRRWNGDPSRLVACLVAEGHPRRLVEEAMTSRESGGPAIGGGRYKARGE